MREAARAEGLAGAVVREMGHTDEAWERLSAAYATIDDGSDDLAVAELAARLASLAFARADRERALELADTALTIADGGRFAEILVDALITKAIALVELGRPAESNALLTHAIKLALEQDLGAMAARGYYNLADNEMGEGRYAEGRDTARTGSRTDAPARRSPDRTAAAGAGGDRAGRAWSLGSGAFTHRRAGATGERHLDRAGARRDADGVRCEGIGAELRMHCCRTLRRRRLGRS